MHFPPIVAFAASVATAFAQLQGFNYGARYTDGAPVTEPGFEAQFNAAKNLVGTSAFTSARIYTLIQAGTVNTPTGAIQAAINTDTSLLLGLWASAGQANIDNELAAFRAAVAAFGTDFTDRIVGMSVGSEDLYRISSIGIENESGIGEAPDVVANYINQVRDAVADTPAAGTPIGHVDTWTAWVNGSNSAVIDASDFIGFNAFAYFENTLTNDIGNAAALFASAYDQTVAVVGGKPLWVTETGWPVSGPTENLAVPSVENAKTYYDRVGCERIFGQTNTWWYTLQDSFQSTPNPSFGLVGAGSSGTDVPTTPLYDLSCSDDSSKPVSSASAIPSSANPASSAKAGGSGGAQRQNKADRSGPSTLASARPSATPAPEVIDSSPPKDRDTPALSETSSATPKEDAPSHSQPTTLITKTTALPAASAGPSGCPASLSTGAFEYPHLIVAVSEDEPDTALGTSYNGSISPSTSSIFNFDIRSEHANMTCTLVFLLPNQDQLETSAFTLGGKGGFKVATLQSSITEETTYNNVPNVVKDLGGPSDVTPGNEYVVASWECKAGSRTGYKVSATGSFDLNYFQDYSPPPIGFYIVVC